MGVDLVSHADAGDEPSQLLPQIVDRLTPNGQLPANLGVGGLGDIAGMLGGLLNR